MRSCRLRQGDEKTKAADVFAAGRCDGAADEHEITFGAWNNEEQPACGSATIAQWRALV
jgi:hypothetical protein